jgi:hypothetical protein
MQDRAQLALDQPLPIRSLRELAAAEHRNFVCDLRLAARLLA